MARNKRKRPFRDGHHIGHACRGLHFRLLVTGLVEGRHGTLSEESARIRRVAQGKCRHRFDVGDWTASDGLGRSQLWGTTR